MKLKPHKGVYKIPIKKDIKGYWCPNRLNYNGMRSTDLPNQPLVTDLTRVPKGSIKDVFKQRIEIALRTTPSANLPDESIFDSWEFEGKTYSLPDEFIASNHLEKLMATPWQQIPPNKQPKPSLWQRIKRKVKR